MTAPIPTEVIEQLRTRAATEAEAIVREAVASMLGDAPDLRDLEQRIRERVLALGGSLLEQALALAGPGYDGASRGCRCGGRQKFVGYRSKQIVTLLAPLTLRRAYYHCRQCHQGTIPLDRRWDVVGTGFSPALREAVAWLTAELPFGRSAELLGRLCRVTISKQWVEQFTHTIGQELEAFPEPLPAVDPLAAGTAELYTEIDGTTIPLRQGWKEVKVAALFHAQADTDNAPQRGVTTYLAHLGAVEPFGARLWQALERLPAEPARREVRIGDGAPWIWNLAALQAPGAVEIVDWYHATEHLWQVGHAVYGDDSPLVAPWVKAREAELWEGQVESVRIALKALQPRRAAGREARRTHLEYFRTHRERMRYDRFRAQGLFIGSGVVEGGGCKHAVGARLKKAGMRWSPEGAQNTLRLRLCILNQQWELFHCWRREQLRNAA